MKRSREPSNILNFIQERLFRFNFIQIHSFTKTLRNVSEHSAKWIVHIKGYLRSFAFKKIHVNERLRESLLPCTFEKVRRRSKKEDVHEQYSAQIIIFETFQFKMKFLFCDIEKK